MNIKKSILLRARIAFLVMLVFAVFICWKMARIQLVEGDKWKEMARKKVYRHKEVKATRGAIFADDGSELANSLPYYKVAFDPMVVGDYTFYSKALDSLCDNLAVFFGGTRTARDYKQKIKDARYSGRQYLVLSRRLIDHQQKKQMEKWPIFRMGRLKGGVIFEKVDKRVRPFNHLAERTIGYVNEDNRGAGLEYSFNKELGGKNGKALFLRIPGGKWKPVYDGTEVKPVQGLDIHTTIDVNLQDIAESALLKALRRHDAEYGAVALMEVRTGEIKAIANLGRKDSLVYAEKYNYIVGNQGLTEPGSTLKLASMMALLEETNLRPSDTVATGDGKYRFYDRIMRDVKPEGYGTITLQEAFEKSSNIAVSRLINEYFGADPQRFIQYLYDFGLGAPLQFQIKGSATPYIKDKTDPSWSGTTLPWMSIGYEMKTSPLHLLMFYNAVANDGKMIEPIIVRKVARGNNAVKTYTPRVISQKICSDKTLETVQSMLTGVVDNGTARNIKSKNYSIAGKTGTAQKLVGGAYSKTYYSSFAGYFPADAPRYSCIVIIDNPKGVLQYGGDVAAPVFKEIVDRIYVRDHAIHQPIPRVAPDSTTFPVIRSGNFHDLQMICERIGVQTVASDSIDEWVTTKTHTTAVEWVDNQIQKGFIPNVVGMTLRDALYVLEANNYRVRYEGIGRVAEQSEFPGRKAEEGTIVTLKLEPY